MRLQDTSEEMKKDIISHFVLRLVYCRTYVLIAMILFVRGFSLPE